MNDLAGNQTVIEIVYLVASALFILSLRWMSSPSTARRGVRAGELGMLLAIAGTLLHHGIVDYKWIVIALVLGTEGAGLTPAVEAAADVRVRIPISGRVDSLNVAVAAGIALYRLRGTV